MRDLAFKADLKHEKTRRGGSFMRQSTLLQSKSAERVLSKSRTCIDLSEIHPNRSRSFLFAPGTKDQDANNDARSPLADSPPPPMDFSFRETVESAVFSAKPQDTSRVDVHEQKTSDLEDETQAPLPDYSSPMIGFRSSISTTMKNHSFESMDRSQSVSVLKSYELATPTDERPTDDKPTGTISNTINDWKGKSHKSGYDGVRAWSKRF